MKAILEAWLKEKVGVIIDIDEIDHTLKDGMLFIRILKYYDAINVRSIRNVFPSDDVVVCRNNLTQLKIWFKLLNIDFTDDVISGIIDGDSALCVDILYQLFVVFAKGDLNYVMKHKERAAITESRKLFQVSRANVCPVESEKRYNPRDEILKKKKVIDWYNAKRDHRFVKKLSDQSSVDTCELNKCPSVPRKQKSVRLAREESKNRFKADRDFVRDECKFLAEDVTSGTSSALTTSCCHVSSRSVVNDYFHVGFLPPISPKPDYEPDLPPHVQRFMQDIKSNTGFFCVNPTESSYGSTVIKDVWTAIVDKEKTHLKDIIASRLLNQSLHEKDLISNLGCILTQHESHKTYFMNLQDHLSSVMTVDASPEDRHEGRGSGSESGGAGDECDTVDRISSHLHSTKQRYVHSNYAAYCRNEKSRTVELHTRLYAETLKLRFERHYTICYHAIEDLIDLAIRQSEFETEYGFKVPPFVWQDWKCLFHHEQSIFDIVSDVSCMLFPNSPTQFEVVCERIRQEILNENDLEMYMNGTGFWENGYNLQLNMDDQAEDNGLSKHVVHEDRILVGHVVHRILDVKYPVPSEPLPADIPKYPIRAIVSEMGDMKAVDEFRELLSKVDILVIDVNTAVNYCLLCFKAWPNEILFDLPQETEIEIRYSNPPDENQPDAEALENEYTTEFTQTTSSLFEATDTSYVEGASKIGRTLFMIMLSGNEVPCSVLVDAIVAYITQHKNTIKGWVLVNFPSTLYQASVMEYILTGKKFPFNLEDDTVSSSDSECKISGIGNLSSSVESNFETEIKSSAIVTNPRKFNDVDTFKTYFSTYVTTVKGTEFRQPGDGEPEDDGHNSSTLLEQPERIGIPTLNLFYKDQGIGHEFMYDTFDSDTLKHLARSILYSFEDVTLQMFIGDMHNEDAVHESESSVQQRSGSLSSLPETISVKRLKVLGSMGGLPVDEQELVPNHVDEVVVSNKVEETRNFADYPISDKAAVALASYWETVETAYIVCFKDMFYLKRVLNYSVIPYISSVAKRIETVLVKEDDRQSTVSAFLEAYNNINQVLRSDDEMKAELHLRVVELKAQLQELCKKKLNDVEHVRQTTIRQNWAYQCMTVYANLFIQALQIEIDLFLRTTSFLQDYYQAMLGNYSAQPLRTVTIPKPEIRLSKELEQHVWNNKEQIEHEEGEEVNEPYDDGDTSEEIAFESLERIFNTDADLEKVDDPMYWITIERLLNYSSQTDLTPPYYVSVEERAQAAYDEIEKVRSRMDAFIASEEMAALKKYKDSAKGVASRKKSRTGKLVTDTSESQSSEPKDKTTDESEESLMRNLFEEWKLAVNAEFERLSFRLDLLKGRFKTELAEVDTVLGNKFSDLNNELNKRFTRELVCIDNLCDLFQTAIEEKTPIQAQLFFIGDLFYTFGNFVSVLPVQIKLPAALEENLMENSFTMRQLEAIKDRLMYIAPRGIITHEAFIKFIQDIIFYSGSGNMQLVPKIWSDLERHETEALVNRLFMNYSMIEWKDFLIYCLGLPYPLTEDIVDARLQFLKHDVNETELISYKNYMSTTLWFERELPDNPLLALRNVLAKEFLFSLFEVGDNMINYTSLLLNCCRDVDPKVGFGKALSLIYGRCVIVYEEDLYLEKIVTDHINTGFKVVHEIISELLDDIVCNTVSTDGETPLDVKEAGVLLTLDKADSSALIGGTGDLLTKSMYEQLFRKHLVLRWTSWVPNIIVNSLLCLTFCALHIPDIIFAQPSFVEVIHDRLMMLSDSDVYLPELLNRWWIKMVFEGNCKFKARSITDIVTEIVLERNY